MLHPIECANEIKKELQRCAQITRELYNWGAFPLEIRWDLRGTVAGTAWMDRRVRFNLLLLREQHLDGIREVAAHEFAHITVFKLWAHQALNRFRSALSEEISFDEVEFLSDPELAGDYPQHHGPEWRRTMLLFGYQPRRLHRFNVTRHRLR